MERNIEKHCDPESKFSSKNISEEKYLRVKRDRVFWIVNWTILLISFLVLVGCVWTLTEKVETLEDQCRKINSELQEYKLGGKEWKK
jgi:hypothetical protein